MDFLFWFALVLGILFVVISLLILALELLVERGKSERHWWGAVERFWDGTRGAIVGGFVFIAFAIALRDLDTGFRLLIVPLGVVGAMAPLVHLVSSMRAAKEDRPAAEREWWQALSDRSGSVMMSCAYAGMVIFAVYAFYSLNNTVDALGTRVQALEKKVDEMGGTLKP